MKMLNIVSETTSKENIHYPVHMTATDVNSELFIDYYKTIYWFYEFPEEGNLHNVTLQIEASIAI